jgi:hypothetical protein
VGVIIIGKIKLQVKGDEACPIHPENQLSHKILRQRKIQKNIEKQGQTIAKKKAQQIQRPSHPLRWRTRAFDPFIRYMDQVLYFQLRKIYIKYFLARTIICAQFLHRNITADRNKLRLFHRAQSPRSGARPPTCTRFTRELTHHELDDSLFHADYFHRVIGCDSSAVSSSTSSAASVSSTLSAGRPTSTSILP